jgi:hypothetical protein
LFDINFRLAKVEGKKSAVVVGYKGSYPAGQQIKLNWEHTEYKFLTKKEALKLDLTEDGRFFVESCKDEG